MNRRSFNAASMAAVLTLSPRLTFAEQVSQGLAGLQLAEINDGRLMTRHQGMATPQVAVNDATLFQVASCSKTVTALAIMTLVRDGRIDLDQPANRYLRRWTLEGARGPAATIAELMSHTAGTTVHGFAGYGADKRLPTLFEILGGYYPANSGPIRARRRLFHPFKYSGGGTMVLQVLIEDVTGTAFATYTTQKVLAPIGAHRATFAIKPATAFAHGVSENGQPVPGGFRRHPESAAAGLWATAADLAKILQAIVQSLSGAHAALLPPSLAQRMVTPVSWRSGLGVLVHPGAVISHEGRNVGYDAIMAAQLDTGRIRAAVTNRNGALESYAQTWVPN